MKSTTAHAEKRELSLPEIRTLMARPCPCQIIQRELEKPGVGEVREFMSITELWADRLERLADE